MFLLKDFFIQFFLKKEIYNMIQHFHEIKQMNLFISPIFNFLIIR